MSANALRYTPAQDRNLSCASGSRCLRIGTSATAWADARRLRQTPGQHRYHHRRTLKPTATQGGGTSATSQSPRKDPADLKMLIMRVQAALFSRGYDPGAIDGVMGAETQAALRQFQKDHGLPITGTMTTQSLNFWGVRL